MKLFPIFFLFMVMNINAQTSDVKTMEVEYAMQLNFNTINSYKTVLLFNTSEALFQYSNQNVDAALKQEEDNYTFNVNDTTKYSIYTSRKEKEVTEIVRSLDEKKYYSIVEEYPVIDWKITSETKEINTFGCIKATCTFKGRNYTAWFTPEIVTNFGPLKMHGLPGLILELSDSKNEVLVYAKSLKKSDAVIAFKNNNEKITRKEYNALVNEKLNEITTNISTKLGREFKVKVKTSENNSIEIE